MATTKVRASQLRGLARQQAPILNNLIPDSNLPGTTGNYRLVGEFFVPDMDIEFDGNHTINYITFIDSKNVDVNMTLGNDEGTFGVTLNNGIEAYFSSALLVVLGNVYSPVISDWSQQTGLIDNKGDELKVVSYDTSGSLRGLVIPDNIDFRFSFRYKISSLATDGSNPYLTTGTDKVHLYRLSDGVSKYKFRIGYNPVGAILENEDNSRPGSNVAFTEKFPNENDNFPSKSIVFERLSGNISVYFLLDPEAKYFYSNLSASGDMGVYVEVDRLDIFDIKYIELAT
ncbi:hypothetical protein [Leeuwenhoekiella parthenopeia]|uniref:Uncharacterized protein n=1 Tax=Leeuwenhoekiella parthenopeia TaxID=2890320 RepID=A0ABS8GMX8_9FLAO|nr:hypothetical protein [Leeuwenhoekiella parthenopeia]MCC4211339.1 hypothetical protein [Leeuwenhoekiella parthenopeia]